MAGQLAVSIEVSMSALGQKRTFSEVCAMSALLPKADMDQHGRDIRFGSKADIPRCNRDLRYSITSSARSKKSRLRFRPSALAVFRLITSSYLVGRSIGRSAGLAPLSILSTSVADRR